MRCFCNSRRRMVWRAIHNRVAGISNPPYCQACFEPGMSKSTYGTGCFPGPIPRAATPPQQLLTTVAYRIGGQATYALEGSILSLVWLLRGHPTGC